MHNANTGMTMEFKYNQNGIRTQKVKKVNGAVTETTDYILKGKTVAAMKKNTDTYYFTYDASGNPATVNFNGANFTYVKNLQSDIVGILDASGDLVVEYKYDAWGDAVSIYSASTTIDDLAFDNPFRYRGYVWDEETGLYYLRSRYYNPKSCRFVNSDIVNESFIYSRVDNCYSYCNCCPLIYIDDDGFVGRVFDLGQNWKFRIDPGNPDGKVQRHIHVWKKGGPHHAQNEDGSVHEKYYGDPPEWIRDKLRELGKWDWKETDQNAIPKPTPNPTPNPTPAPGPVPPPYPVYDSETDKQKAYSNTNINTTELVVIEIIGVIGACIVAGIKLAASFATGGMIPAW